VSVTVPFNCSACLALPFAPQSVYGDKENPMFADVREHICHLQAGSYTVSYRLSQPLKRAYDLDTPMWELREDPETVKKLEGLLDLTGIAEEYMGRSVRAYADMHRATMDEERLRRIGAALEA